MATLISPQILDMITMELTAEDIRNCMQVCKTWFNIINHLEIHMIRKPRPVFHDLPSELLGKIVTHLSHKDHVSAQLVCQKWFLAINVYLKKPLHFFLHNTVQHDEDSLKYISNCSKECINSLTVENYTNPLVGKADTWPNLIELILRPGNSIQNNIFLMQHFSRGLEALKLAGNSLIGLNDDLYTQHKNVFKFSQLKKFSFNLYYNNYGNGKMSYYDEYLFVDHIRQQDDNFQDKQDLYQQMKVLGSLFNNIHIPTLTEVEGTFPFCNLFMYKYEDLQKCFSKFLEIHGPNILKMKIQVSGPLEKICKLLKPGLEALVRLKQLNLQLNLFDVYEPSTRLSDLEQELVRLLTCFKELSTFYTNIRGLVLQSILNNYGHQLESLFVIPWVSCPVEENGNWLYMSNCVKLKKLTTNDIRFHENQVENFELLSLEYLRILRKHRSWDPSQLSQWVIQLAPYLLKLSLDIDNVSFSNEWLSGLISNLEFLECVELRLLPYQNSSHLREQVRLHDWCKETIGLNYNTEETLKHKTIVIKIDQEKFNRTKQSV